MKESGGMEFLSDVYLYQVVGVESLHVEVEALRGPTGWSFTLSVGLYQLGPEARALKSMRIDFVWQRGCDEPPYVHCSR